MALEYVRSLALSISTEPNQNLTKRAELASPTFSHIIREARVFFQVTQVVNILEECAADPTHTPALCKALPVGFSPVIQLKCWCSY